MQSTAFSFDFWSKGRRKSGDDDADFGLDLDCSHGLTTANGELLDWGTKKQARKISDAHSYGSVAEKPIHFANDAYAEIFGKLYRNALQAFAALAVVWVLFMIVHHHLHLFGISSSATGMSSPSPSAPGSKTSARTCSAYKYPQCETAMQWYLSRNAATRCEAFEHVKAEGDLVKFPYSATLQDMCDISDPGCCGCAGQCSKCPPLLAECMSWLLDGSWKIAFAEGTVSKYSFDAHGHCEIELPSSSLPVTWKWYPQAFIPNGSDLSDPQLMTVSDAKERCRKEPRCKGITYDQASGIGNNVYEIFFKLVSTVAPAPGTGWITFVEEDRPELHDTVAVAGPLTQVASNVSGTFRFDLHKAAPYLFPGGCAEQLMVTNDELRVERACPGMEMQIGQGLRSK